ncbi:hypothetical protein [Robinsoniella peoriensis]|uniref:hypothetical protein n=1 Tax=Robinsoniella peoriensis TaxID=180332 RepID=UPI002915137C|nr:hypothetical protein [Clostridiales bacterium]
MDFYDCPYVQVIPFRNGNEYDEGYGCMVTRSECMCCGCKISQEEAERLLSLQED